MYSRFYTLTQGVEIGRLVNHGKNVFEDRVSSDAELIDSAIKFANRLYTDRTKTLQVFSNLDDAKMFAHNNMTNYTGYTKDTPYERPSHQRAVVEILVDTTAVALWKEKELKTCGRDPISYFEMPNHAINYVTSRVWIRHLDAAELHSPQQSYVKIFSKSLSANSDTMFLFRDYHSPKLFSLHWRHHKDLAREITTFLNGGRSPIEIFDYLFKIRQRLFSESSGFNISGSFMRRLETALKKFSDVVCSSGKITYEIYDKALECKKVF